MKQYLFFIFTSILIISCSSDRKKDASAQQKGGKPPTPKVDLFIVKTQTMSESLQVPGSITAEDATEIHPEVSGRITALYAREGQFVGKGAVLAKIYDGDLQAQKRKLQVQLQIARQTEARHAQLLKIGGISQEDYATTGLQVSNLRADLDIINTAISKTVIRAPFSGKLGLKQTSSGAFVTPQSIIATIQKTHDLNLDFNLPEKYANQIRNGQFVNFDVEGSRRTYTAKIAATQAGIDPGTRTLAIRAQVIGDRAGLFPGNFASVRLNFEPDPNALMIPSQAIIPQARGKKVIVYRNGTADFVSVTTGNRDSSMVQVLSGLAKGDSIVVTGLLTVKPNAKLQVAKVVNKAG